MFGPFPTYDPLGDTLPLTRNPRNNNNINMMLDDPGPMPPDLMGGDDPAFENMNRAALHAWQERQRRQRTLRMLMMFLMILLLMDGEDPPNNRRHHNSRRHQHLRQKGKRLGGGVGSYFDEDGNLISPLNPVVYRSRIQEDRVILKAIKSNADSRYHELVKQNGGKDVEEELRQFIDEKLKEEAAKTSMIFDDADDGKEGKDSSGDEGASEDSDADQKVERLEIVVQVDNEGNRKVMHVGDSTQTTSASEEKMKEKDELAVFHYPRNATGYYRGLWVRTHKNTTSDHTGSSKDGKDAKLAGAKSEHDAKQDDKNSPPQRNVTVGEIQTWAQTQLHQRKKDVGLLFLPPNVYLEEDNSTSETDNELSAEDASIGYRSPSSSTATSKKRSPYVALTKEAGRAGFQLYSRPIPAMNELSIVDGLVKLYDGMTNSFVSRRTDVLLRVKGVMIHGVGKMSLVTTGGVSGGETKRRRRSFLGVRKMHEDESDVDVELIEDDDEETILSEDEMEEESIDRRRRRLQEAVDQLNNGSKSGDVGSIVARIRQEAMDLYSSHYNTGKDGGLDNPESDEEFGTAMENSGWTRLQSVDEGYEDLDDILSNGQRKLRKVDDHLMTVTDDALSSLSTDEKETTKIATNAVNASFSQQPLGKMLEYNDTDLILRRSALSSSPTHDLSAHATQYVYPYPYVIDDAENSIKEAMHSPVTRRIPSREVALEANALGCEFELNIDVKATKWTFGEWRSAMEHRLRMGGIFNPYWNISASSTGTSKGGESNVVKLKQSQYLMVMKSQLLFLEEQTPKEALVMNMMGDITSDNCDFHSFVNVTAMRTNWEHTTAKAINYSFYMMLTCLTQIVILLRQLLHTQSQSVATNVSLLCIGWQTVLDAILCISHIFLCLVMQPLFTAFASVAFFKLLIFCVIEMKYMAIIIQARNNANNNNNNGGLTQEELRKQITLLHLKFYGALMSAIIAFWYFGQSNRTLYVLLLYSFWVPQIILNIITESRKPMHNYYMYGMSISRLIAPIYVFAVPNNFLKEVNPDFPTEPRMCQLLILWICFQTAVLYAQSKYGTRFMIPQRFLPPKFDYSRPIPSSLLPRPASNSSVSSSEIELGPLLNGDSSPSRETGVARNRRGGANRTRHNSEDGRTTSMSEDTGETPTLDCVICYNEIDVNDRRGYMLAPCDHIFHRHCLEQWMEVKMECPICRCNLPSI